MLYNDVWQLSWVSSSVNPVAFELTDSAGWARRCGLVAYQLHDWLFIYGGGLPPTYYYDDIWDELRLWVDVGPLCRCCHWDRSSVPQRPVGQPAPVHHCWNDQNDSVPPRCARGLLVTREGEWRESLWDKDSWWRARWYIWPLLHDWCLGQPSSVHSR